MILKNIIPLLLISILSSTAIADPICDSIITRELEQCVRVNFESSDRNLNSAYKILAQKLSPQQRKILLTSQREWVIYKEKICQAVYDFITPGQEAGIEKWSCLDEITKTRSRELRYIDSASGMNEFFRAADIVSKLYEGGDRSRFIDKLTNMALENSDSHWNYYITENCKLLAARFHEEKRECIARQVFYEY
ncbi:lysozyme inhibitor LprI family protein [Paraburkholderia caffeinilytica]|uniref:lysozyme inhibitor LprI family protein n=1 Tax=Paraburkholderia caffeinilytica TaxID=1761016 RepID=UPI000E2109DC|nr:lysozyme inhibitor LprI family protein [Paraburkholderia caffeinilytica]CAB3788561.1 hypothetical protein LMG28690_02682 [Paraburkholderia caffeinilytica]